MTVVISLSDGQAFALSPAFGTYEQISSLVFENGAAPAGSGITKAPGNPPAWVEFPAVSGQSARVRIKQANIVGVWEQ